MSLSHFRLIAGALGASCVLSPLAAQTPDHPALPRAVPARGSAPPTGYFRMPALHGDTLVFVAEGDLWRVSASGGTAQRLTTHPAEEASPAISPDGRTIAYSASYEGPTEIYTMGIEGGLPTRRTFEGGNATVTGWTPDGRVLYRTGARSLLRDQRLASIDLRSGRSTMIPLSQASEGVYDPAGKALVFTRQAFQGSHTRRYQGGTAQNLWRFAGNAEAEPLTGDWAGTSKSPMWWQGRIYFLSDRDGTMNIWSMDERGKDLRQHTHSTVYDIQAASLSDGRIAYQIGADIRLYDISKNEDSAVPIRLVSDFDQMRERWVKSPIEWVSSSHLSPTGDRVVLTVRGQLVVVPSTTGQGRVVEATHDHKVRWREGHFMPDGKSLLALSDESGEVEFWRASANGAGTPTQLTNDAKVLRWDGIPSPDGRRIAHTDKNQQIWVYDIASKQEKLLATSKDGDFGDLIWSPDSRWLAFTAPAANTFTQVFVYDANGGASTPVTSARYDSYSPAWSPDGKWLYFLSDRTLESVVGSVWGSRQPEPYFDKQTKIYALALQSGERFPYQPDDELYVSASNASERADSLKKIVDSARVKPSVGGPPKQAVKAAAPKPMDLAGLQARLYEVPLPAGNYSSLAVDDKRLYYLSREGGGRASKTSLMTFPIGNRGDKAETYMEEVRSYELSQDGKKVLVRKGPNVYVFDAAAKAGDPSKAQVDLSSWTMHFDPRDEWRQMYTEAWRAERDYFYDRGMHGLDWPAIREKYLPLAERVTDRSELNEVLGQMVSELSALHIFVVGGDARAGTDRVDPASLGAVFERDEGASGYRVASIYAVDPDDPAALAPLARPDVDVHEGDVIESVNGVPTLSVPDVRELLRGAAGKQVLLHVRPRGSATARDVVVVPISSRDEDELRYAAWEYDRRQRVETAGKGRIGYVHLRAMGGRDIAQWARDFYPVFDRDGLIIDVRHNNGGNIDSWILEKLLRKAWFYFQPRVGNPSWNMQYAFRGHMVVLSDEHTSSDGEAFGEGFRRLGLGKVIGTRTWGGEIWLSFGDNALVDRGVASAAELGVYSPEGQWLIEGHGVDPDIVVDNLPYATYNDGDAQLDAAISYLQSEIKAHPIPVPPAPKYPNKAIANGKKN